MNLEKEIKILEEIKGEKLTKEQIELLKDNNRDEENDKEQIVLLKDNNGDEENDKK